MDWKIQAGDIIAGVCRVWWDDNIKNLCSLNHNIWIKHQMRVYTYLCDLSLLATSINIDLFCVSDDDLFRLDLHATVWDVSGAISLWEFGI